jgi:hypothetical protein
VIGRAFCSATAVYEQTVKPWAGDQLWIVTTTSGALRVSGYPDQHRILGETGCNRGRNMRLKRTMALKVLANHPERMALVEREAQVLA